MAIRKIIVDSKKYNIPILHKDHWGYTQDSIPVRFIAYPDLIDGTNATDALYCLHKMYEMGVNRRESKWGNDPIWLDRWFDHFYALAQEVVYLLYGPSFARNEEVELA